MTQQRPLIEKVLDIALYAPVGLALGLHAGLDARVVSGRTRVSERFQVARWIGEMAVTYGRRELDRWIDERCAESGTASPPVISTVAEPEAAIPPAVIARAPSLSPPFVGYQSLAAAQVVQLLGRLSVDELVAIRTYETANRARRTILAKLDQLPGNG
ncbi:MAG TPA: hypothetical protein PK020_16630 [Ilumatobacteraceae bacterium]|nr:hypothetical protein [Ilumatobacteraceae bacterium]HRB02408.1 hypothetical protein [Ilumatobacteraceae bacterium]